MLRHFVRRGLLDDGAATDMLTWQAAGGFSLDASVRVEGHNRAGRDRLLRYCARPPFALERLAVETSAHTAVDDSNTADLTVRRVIYRLPRATHNGRTLLTLSPLEFLDALAHLMPPPRVHRQRYHGVLAPNARLRGAVTAWARKATQRAETGSQCFHPQRSGIGTRGTGTSSSDPASGFSLLTGSSPSTCVGMRTKRPCDRSSMHWAGGKKSRHGTSSTCAP